VLGYNKPLKWSLTGDGGVRIEIPDALQSPENSPCEYAWTFNMVREFADAAHEAGLKFGVCCAPWDRNNVDYGKPEYLQRFRERKPFPKPLGRSFPQA
jgi:hypothetical protein